MIIAFQRTIGTASMSMIADEDWSALKIKMCKEWAIEQAFDDHKVWPRLRNQQIVTYDGEMYQIWDTTNQGECADELFQGRHIEVLDEEHR